ncbi:MAG: HAMP domain-containing protein [Cytophagales bacterium]
MKLPAQFNTIRFKLSLVIGILTVVYSCILVSYFNYKYKTTLLNDAIEKSNILAKNYASDIRSEMERALDISRTTAQIFSSQVNTEYPLNLTREDANIILRNIVDKNRFLSGIYTAWEPNKFDNKDPEYAGLPGNHANGNFVPYWYRDTKTEKLAFEPLKLYLQEGKGDYYLKTRISRKETVIDPIKYKIGDRQVLLMTLVVPILTPKEEFVGIVGADISCESLQKLVDQSTLFDGYGQLAIISYNGTVVAATNKENLLGLNVKFVLPDIHSKIQGITGAKSFVEQDTLKTFVPILIGATKTPWYIVIKVPLTYLTAGLIDELLKLTLFGLLFLGLLVSITSYYIKKLLSPVRKITRIAQKVAVGNLDEYFVESTTTEIEQLNEAFKKVIESQKGITEVTEAIAGGDYGKRAIVKSEFDVLASSVNLMIDNLKTSTEEDNKRKWSNEGYAQFAELLRSESDLKKLSQLALNYLIKYLNGNQGGLFVATGKEPNIVLELVATFAYNRVKFIHKTIKIGEGLVGQAYLERESVFLTEIPANYVQITSGLGDANPNCLIIVPLLNNEVVEGVLEMASFVSLLPHQIDFIEKCAVSLASVIASTRVNDLTNKLLREAQEKTELMKMQEEGMRQNMEELAATQEEMNRKEDELLARIKELEEQVVSS